MDITRVEMVLESKGKDATVNHGDCFDSNDNLNDSDHSHGDEDGNIHVHGHGGISCSGPSIISTLTSTPASASPVSSVGGNESPPSSRHPDTKYDDDRISTETDRRDHRQLDSHQYVDIEDTDGSKDEPDALTHLDTVSLAKSSLSTFSSTSTPSCLVSSSAGSSSEYNSLFCSRQSSIDDHVFLALSLPNCAVTNIDSGHSPCRSTTNSASTSPRMTPRMKLVNEGDIHVCRLNHTRTVISKLLSSKFLRRWEVHHLYLNDDTICSKTPTGFMDQAISYSNIVDIYHVSRWDTSQKFCLRAVLTNGSLLLQTSNAYIRDQWLHSLHWKRSMFKFSKVLVNSCIRTEVLLKELGLLVELALTTTLQDESVGQTPLIIISSLLVEINRHGDMESDLSVPSPETVSFWYSRRPLNEQIITIIAPLLEHRNPTNEICSFLSKHCLTNSRSSVVSEFYGDIAQRVLKHNMDFGKCIKMRLFIQHYIVALNSQNDGYDHIRTFVQAAHSHGSTCPHPRVLTNLVSVCLAAIFSLFDEQKNLLRSLAADINRVDCRNAYSDDEFKSKVTCFVNVFYLIIQFDDWRPMLAQLLQPVPFPDIALAYEHFTCSLKPVLACIAKDKRCDVHQTVLGVRDDKDGWLSVYCPGNIACDDDGQLWSAMLESLTSCCCRRKSFMVTLNKSLGPLMLRALRDDETCQKTLCWMLELNVIESKDMQLQVTTTLQSTPSGKCHYADLCQRQLHLKELQQKGGPRKLTLPSRSTDADVQKLLNCGSLGNLECLSLAFTQVTSACAEQLIKLPSLRYLNLWSTQFGDSGLQIISEHLHKLQVLNLCETPVTDKGLEALGSLKGLRKLNLNSTNLSAQTFQRLKERLPSLQECDIRYTEAW